MLLVGAVVLYGVAAYLFRGLHWTPLEVPVELVKGYARAGDFESQWNVTYEIRLDTERKLGLQEQNCLLGIETIVPERCASVPVQLSLSWAVEANGKAVAKGVSADTQAGYWGPTMGKILGHFQANRGTRYRVAIEVEESSSQLQKSNPHLKVEIDPAALKWTYVWEGLLIIAATSCFLLAVVLSLIAGGQALLKSKT